MADKPTRHKAASQMLSAPRPALGKHAKQNDPDSQKTDSRKTDAKGPRDSRKTAVVVAGCAGALLLVWGIGAAYFSGRFAPGTVVNGIDAAGMTESDLASRVEGDIAAWKANVTGDGVSFDVSATDIDLTVDAASFARDAMARNDGASWPLGLFSQRTIKAPQAFTLSEEKALSVVDDAIAEHNANAAAPANATCAYSASSGKFEIVPESAGSAIDAASVSKKIQEAARSLATSASLGADELEKPAVTSESPELAEAIKKADAMLAVEIPLTKEGHEVARVGKDLITGWIVVGPDLTVTINQDSVAAWAGGALGEQVAKSDEVNDYEIDGSAIAETLAGQIASGMDSAVEIPLTVVDSRPEESEGARSRGRHIDINLSNQYARLYDEGGNVLWRSYIVTGNTSEGRGTPTGTYAINAKQRHQTLVGLDEDHDGEPDYRSEVSYWMPFIGNGIGLHDADWRSNFGGGIYAYAGSHGCVNLPPEEAAELYSLINVGDKVYVHW